MIHNMMKQFWKDHGRISSIHARLHAHQPPPSRAASTSMCPCDKPGTSNSKLPASLACNGPGTSRSTRTGQPVHLGSDQDGDIPKAKDQRPLDMSRAMDMDDRDPRTEPHNGHTSDTTCRESLKAMLTASGRYIPKVGSRSQNTMVENRPMVLRMLNTLEPLMRGAKPTAAICLAMQRKIDAEEALTHATDKELMNHNVMCYVGTPKGQSFGDEGTSNHGTSANHSKVFGNSMRSDSSRLSSASGQRAQRALDCRGEGSIGLATPGRFQFRSLPIWPRPSRSKCHELQEGC